MKHFVTQRPPRAPDHPCLSRALGRLLCQGMLCLAGWGGMWACTRVDQVPTPAQLTPPPASLMPIEADAVPGQTLVLDFAHIVPNPAAPFEVRLGAALYGGFSLSGHQLIYRSDQEGWRRDSATLSLCQNGGCGQGIIRIRNLVAKSPCTDADTIYWRSSFTGFEITLVPAGEPGKITLWRTANYTADTMPGGRTLNYTPVGGAGYPRQYGYDFIDYQVEWPGGGCRRGVVEVALNGTCFVSRFLSVSLPLQGRREMPIDPALLQQAAQAEPCRRNLTGATVLLTERGDRFVTTPRGRISDTVIRGERRLYYRALGTPTAAEPDRVPYFLLNPIDSTYYRGLITISP